MSWLQSEPAPRHLVQAVKMLGTEEVPGPASNPEIARWARELGGWVSGWYSGDHIPWCGLFVAAMLKRAGRDHGLSNPLSARAWTDYGVPAPSDGPELGDILVFARTGGGHVGFYVGEDADAFHVLGGNQSDRVSVARFARSRLVAARRPPYKLKPANVRRVKLTAAGELSTDEE